MMKKYGYLSILFLVFLGLRLISIGSVYLWLDEVDFLGNTFGENRWSPTRFVPFNEDEAWRVIGEGTWLEAVETSIFMVTNLTTAPWFPVFLLHLLIRIFGHHLLLLRLPALAVSLLSCYLLWRILAKVFRDSCARILPLIIFSFSVPGIIYGQSPQPVIYYFFSTVIQTSILVDILQREREGASIENVLKSIRLLARVSLLTFLLNYMSALVCLLFLAFYLAATMSRKNRRWPPGVCGRVIGETIFSLLPLGILSFLRYRVGDHRIVYGVGGIGNLAKLTFEFLTYNFNFAYTPGLYKPSGLNPVTWPFIVLLALGLFYFIARHKKYRLPALIVFLILCGFIYSEIMPFGGVRHTLTLSPFLYLMVAFGIEAIGKSASRRIQKIITAVLALYIVFIFSISGRQLYLKRRPSLDLGEIAQLAKTNDVSTVVGYKESVLILALMSRTQGNFLERTGIRLCQYDPVLNTPPPGKYLLVSYRHAINPFFKGMAWRAAIPVEEFGGAAITPLVEYIGPLEPRPDIMAPQSVYYPLNGAFIYLVEP